MKLFGRTIKFTNKKKEKCTKSLEVAEVDLAQCNLVDNQYQQKYEVLCTFTPNKCYAYLLNVEPGNIIEFDDITVAFVDQNGRLLKGRINLTLLINK